MLEKLNDFKIGDKVTLYKKDIYGEPFKILATLESIDFKEYGYFLNSGGWSLYSSSEKDILCHQLIVRLYKKRSLVKFRTNFEIIDIKSGWDN